MSKIRETLLLLFLNLTWITLINARCESTKEVKGRTHCVVDCQWGNRVCECDVGYEECEFTLVVDELYSFVSYQILGVNPEQIRGSHGTLYNLNNVTGNAETVREGRTCSNYPDNSVANCTEPNWVDGKTFKVMIGINGVVPSPTIIVDFNSTIIANVRNQLISESTSLHWHGLEQFNTPWMDGVGEITQCGIRAATNFTYAFKASKSGTFWYHSHTGTQRADGHFGALVIRESSTEKSQVDSILMNQFNIGEYQDLPNEHTLVLSDWFEGGGVEEFTQLNSGLGFFPTRGINVLPRVGDTVYSSTRTYDASEIGPTPYFSALINGKGRQESVLYNQSRLSVFNVTQGQTYRFRMIGAQSLYALRLSIDGHLLTTIATDAYTIEPIKNVDYIIIHSGERYDFLLTANQTINNYIMRIETLEADSDCNGTAPFASLNHFTEAILHYATASGDNGIPSTDYESISMASPRRTCTMANQCRAVNCPFENFHMSYWINCVNVAQFRLLIDTPPDKLPQALPSPDHLFFLNFNFEGESFTSAINGRNFILPPYPPLTQNAEFIENSKICNRSIDCSVPNIECLCTHQIEIEFNKTVQIVVSAVGQFDNAHPLHIHGHTFHVVRIGYPSYFSKNSAIQMQNRDIKCETPIPQNQLNDSCGDMRSKCTQPSWNGMGPALNISSKTPRKDTVIVPAGGYVVVNFISDNPGTWFLHCHIEAHQLEGMALLIQEARERQNPPPAQLTTCGDFDFNSTEFYDKLQFTPSPPSPPSPSSPPSPPSAASILQFSTLVFIILQVSIFLL